jgi:hypothetical protein
MAEMIASIPPASASSILFFSLSNAKVLQSSRRVAVAGAVFDAVFHRDFTLAAIFAESAETVGGDICAGGCTAGAGKEEGTGGRTRGGDI